MVRILVVSDDGATTVEISTDGEGWTSGLCDRCGETISDRSHFEDTVQAAEIHVDRH